MLWIYTAFSSITTLACLASAYRSTKVTRMFLGYLLSSKLNLLILANMGFCLFALFGKFVQHVFLGNLREVEKKKLQDRLVNFVLFKLMFVAAMLEHRVGDVLVWIGWFAAIGFLKVFAALVRDRMDYVLSANNGDFTHARPLFLLVILFGVNFVAAAFGTWMCNYDWSISLFMCFECVNIFLDCMHTFAKCGIFYYDSKMQGNWENRGYYMYMAEFIAESLLLFASFLHYVHILYMVGVSFTLIDVVLLLNVKNVVTSLQKKISSYRMFIAMEEELRDRYQTVQGEELPADQVCAICRESMDVAKRLPCNHLYHLRCIRAWLEQNQHSCPMCRYDLRKGHDGEQQQQQQQQPQNDWWGWLGPFVGDGGVDQGRRHVPNELDRIAEMFPHLNREVIAAELNRTGSVEETIDNIVEGRIAGGAFMPNLEEAFMEPPNNNNDNNNNVNNDDGNNYNEDQYDDDDYDEEDESSSEQSQQQQPQQQQQQPVIEDSVEVRRRLALEAALRRSGQ